MDSNTTSISVAWAYSCRNAGDTAINYGTLEWLNSSFPEVTPKMISRYSRETPDISTTIQSLNRRGYQYDLYGGPISYNPKRQSNFEKISALASDFSQYAFDLSGLKEWEETIESEMSTIIRNSDLFLFNGGNLIHHSPHRGFLPYVLAIMYPMVVARRNNIPYGILPQTMFNLEGPYETIITSVLDDAEFIWCRDKRTYEYLSNLSSISTPIYNGLDIGFLSCKRIQTRYERHDTDHIAVVPRFSTLGDTEVVNEENQSTAEPVLKKYIEEQISDGNSVTVVVQTESENEWVQDNYEFLKSTGVSVFESFNQDDLCDFYASCDLLVTMRLHAGIFSLTQGTPTVGVYRKEWGHKMPGTWETLGIEDYCESWDNVGLTDLHTLTDDALNNRDQFNDEVYEKIEEITSCMVEKLDEEIARIL